jgi:predicted alpha/beta-hydrolase family hydrolase
MNAAEWKVEVGAEGVTTAVYEPATTGRDDALFVCAHGAGGSMSDRSTLAAATALRARGFGVVRFNFLYKEKKSGRPDPMPKLMTTFAAVVERARLELGSPRPLIIGGRSMGGRAASMLAADGFAADGLLLLAYPLHPAGQPEKLRDAHLPRITMPVLCFSGTRDPLCTRELMERALTTVTAPWEMHWLDGADHSFHVLKSSGRNDAAVLAEVGDASAQWLSRLGPGTPK